MNYKVMQKNTFQFQIFIFFLLAILFSQISNSQTLNPLVHSKKAISAEFILNEVAFEDMLVVSNVLKIKNNNANKYVFTVRLSLPVGWQTLNNSTKEYSLSPNDSLFIPVRILTKNKSAKGGTKYNINAFVTTIEGRQMALASFRAGRPKISNWDVNILPRPRIYFLNNQNEVPFQINITNNGDEPQELLLSMNRIGKNFVVADGNGNFLKKNYYEFTLPPSSDTLVPFTAVVQKPERNIRRIDNFGYMPNFTEQERHFGLYVKASEVGVKPGTSINKNKKIDFVKLGNNINFVKLNNSTTLNQYGYSTIPVTMVLNLNNILGQQPIMNAIFNGNTQLNSKASLNYFLQTGFTYYKTGTQTMANSAGIIGYNHLKGNVFVGSNVGLNIDNLRSYVNGKGISAGYRLTPKQSIGAYFVRNGTSFANYQSTAFGAAYGFRFSRLQFMAGYGKTSDINGNYSNSINSTISAPLGRFQNIGFSTRYTINNISGININSKSLGLYYSATYLKRKANTRINLNYTEALNYSGLGLLFNNTVKNYRVVLTNSYSLKKRYVLSLVNNYNSYQIIQILNPNLIQNNILFNNVLTLQIPNQHSFSLTPSIYLLYSDYFTEKMVSSGLQLSANTSNYDNYFRMGVFFKGGYNQLLQHPELGTFFNGQANSILSYRTWNFNVRYNYGPTGQGNMVNVLSDQSKYPQRLGLSLGNQYQFENNHFLFENTVNYSYLNINQRHNMGLYSQLFYFTNNGWRFNLNISYSYNISQSYKYVFSSGAINNFVIQTSDIKSKSQSFQFGMGVKKDFGIPIPKKFRKSRFCNANFKVFLDVNGNKKFDTDEIPLENIVLRMNDFEVLSNEKGEASFINMAMAVYKLQVLPLVDVGAWFPVTPDSMDVCGPNIIYIPFSKGVEILGNVVIDREKFSAGINEKIDISRIKIFLIDTLGKTISAITDNRGNFKFYVPYGQYNLKFDESILGNNFELAENDIDVELTSGMESYYHTFFIIEKKRKVKNKKFGADGSVIESESEADSYDKSNNNGKQNDKNKSGNNEKVENLKTFDKAKSDSTNKSVIPDSKTEAVENLKTFGSNKITDANNSTSASGKINWAQMDSLINILIGKTDPPTEISAEDLARIEESKITRSDLSKFANKTVYTIQIGAYSSGLPKKLLAEILKLKVKVESFKDPKDGLTKYFSGYYDTYDDASNARTEIEQRGLNGPFIIAIHNGEIISIQDLLKKIGK
jgi:hypothetical protein